MSVSSLHQIKWAAADSNFFFFSGYIPQGALLGTVSEIMSLMITTLILLQTHLNAAYPGSLINTLQGRPLCPFFLSEAPWWNRPITVVISAPMLQMTGPHYLQQPWKLRSYWFSEIQFYFLACGWFLVAAEGEEKSLEVCVCVCGWQLSITCQWDESHPLERRHIGERQGGGGLLFLPYLSFSFTASLCLLVWCALPPTFYSPYPLLRLTRITLVIELNLDFKRSLPGNRMCSYLFVCHFPGLPLSYHSNAINSFVSTPGRENEFHAECNIQCKHAPMHVPVYLQPCLSKQSEFRSAL